MVFHTEFFLSETLQHSSDLFILTAPVVLNGLVKVVFLGCFVGRGLYNLDIRYFNWMKYFFMNRIKECLKIQDVISLFD